MSFFTRESCPERRRDGLPNVIPRRCPSASWSLPRRPLEQPSGSDGINGSRRIPDDPRAWVGPCFAAWRSTTTCRAHPRPRARDWVVQNFDAHKNGARLLEKIERAIGE